MKIKLISVCALFLLSFELQAQVGIGTTSPDASSILDITATDKGVLVPRVSLTNVTNTTTPVVTPATGLLVWNTNAGVTGGNGVGFYFFNGTQWIPIQQTASIDHDFYEEGTTTAPDDINDDQFTMGNLAIGKNTANYPLDVSNTSQERSINIDITGADDSDRFSIYNSNSNSGIGTHIGMYNLLSGGGSGSHQGIQNSLSGSGSGEQAGIYNTISNTGNGQQVGTQNQISGGGTGVHRGVYSILAGTGSGNQFGVANSIINTGNGVHTGVSNFLSGTGSGEKRGVVNQFSVNSNGNKTGVYNLFEGNNGGTRIGTRNNFLGMGNGTQIGMQNVINNSGTGIHYGSYTTLNGVGSGNKYGSYNRIVSTSGGTHYGIYSEVIKTGSYAGYFLGNVSIGTTTANNYILPSSRGTANQIMQADGTGNVTWVDPSTLNVPHRIDDLLDGKSDNDGTNNGSSIFLGINAGANDDASDNSNIGIGFNALQSSTTAYDNVAIGSNSQLNTSIGHSNTSVGKNALYYTYNGSQNTALGLNALHDAIGQGNVGIGVDAGYTNDGSYNVFIGYQAGYNDGGNNRLYIENSNSSSPLIYGEFNNDLLRVNGTLDINNAYQFPTTDGAVNQIMRTDGAGNLAWISPLFPTSDGIANQIIQTDGSGNLSWISIPQFPTTSGLINQVLQADGFGNVNWITPSIGDLTTFTANNGLNYNSASNSFRLGGNLIENTTINQGLYGMIFNLNSTGDFVVQDAGVPHFQISDTGISYFGDNTQWRDNNALTGTLFAQIYDDADDGAMVLYENGLTQILFDANGMSVFNEQGFDRDFRVESLNRTSALHVDASVDVLRVGSATGNLNSNNTVINGITIDYVADFDNSQVTGTAVGIGSVEYLLDGNSMTHINTTFAPISHLNLDLGGGSTLAWDDVWADDFWNISDSRAKESVSDLDYGLDEILSMNPVSYKLKDDPFKDQKLGLMAQDILKLVPEAVKTHDYKVLNENNLDAYSKIELERMGISYTTLIPVLINAIKEQQEQIEQLEYENILMETQYQELLTKFNTQQQEINEIKDLLKM